MNVENFMEWYCLVMAQVAPYALIVAICSRFIKWIIRCVTGGRTEL